GLTHAGTTDPDPTSAAAADAAPRGFSFYVVEGTRASIGDIYVSEPHRGSGIDRQLLLAILSRLETLPRLRRIESQSVSFDNHGADQVFLSRGFERFERRFMIAHLAPRTAPDLAQVETQRELGPGTIKKRKWQEDAYGAAVRTIFRSYRGEDDSRINSQYGSEEGCAELLSILTDTVWCGRFLPEASRVAACSVTG